jgi:hypothetical protein
MIARQFFLSLSYIFHPLVMPFLGLYLLFNLETSPVSYNQSDALFYFPDNAKTYIYLIVGILTILAPLLSLVIMYYNKLISSLHLMDRKERIYPFVLVSFYYFLAYYYVRFEVPEGLRHPALIGFLFGMLVLFVLSFIANFYIKISLHSAAIFGLSGMILGYSQTQLPPDGVGVATNIFMILYLVIVAGLVSGGRLYLKAHTLSEIILGATLGFVVMFVTVKFGLFL